MSLDTDTSREGDLHYEAVFSPSVAPWKRHGARGTLVWDVDGDPSLDATPGELRALEIGGAAESGAVEFSAELELELVAGVARPFPSTDPSMRLHRVRAIPQAELRWFKDADDIYWVVSDFSGALRMELELSGDPAYFSYDSDGLELGADDARVSIEARRQAEVILSAAGIDAGLGPAAKIQALVEWLRGFGSAELGADAWEPGSRVELIAGRAVGVCRHRAFLFVLVSQGLGYPARYVYNEAHAFAEIRDSLGRWVRVDFGGDARSLTLSGEHTLDAARAITGTDDPAAVVTGRSADVLAAEAARREELARLADEIAADPAPALSWVSAEQGAKAEVSATEPLRLRGRIEAAHGGLPDAVDLWLVPVGSALAARRPVFVAGPLRIGSGEIELEREIESSWLIGEWQIRPVAVVQ